MPANVPLLSVLAICDPTKSWPWRCPAPSDEALRQLLAHAPLVADPVEGDATAEQHIGRIRYLANHGWWDPIEIDVGVPCLGYPGPSWPVTDGNHRLWAATIRGDHLVEVDISGQVDHAARLLGVPGLLANGLEHAAPDAEQDASRLHDEADKA